MLAIMFLHDIIIDRPSNKEWFMFILINPENTSPLFYFHDREFNAYPSFHFVVLNL